MISSLVHHSDQALPATARAFLFVGSMDINPKQERYAQLIVEGHTQAEAYRRSHPNSLKWKDETVWSRASELMADSKVSARVAELRAEVEKEHGVTVASLIRELEEARIAALSAPLAPQSSAAVSATMGKARITGLDKQVGTPENPLSIAANLNVSVDWAALKSKVASKAK